jgi:GTP-binding protein
VTQPPCLTEGEDGFTKAEGAQDVLDVKLLEARFVKSAASARDIPADRTPQVALVGRSNVGKSSLINALTRRTLARTSGAPGKTRLANLYRLSLEGGAGGPGQWAVYLADLPGYGYASGGRESVAELRQVAEEYFRSFEADEGRDGDQRASRLRGVFHLIDARHPGLESDLDAAEWIATLGVDHATIATKIDKLSRRERATHLQQLARQLGTAALPCSAESGEGLDDLWTLIARLSR